MIEPNWLFQLKFYREEIRHEFALYFSRFNILIACQSFLVVPFAILHAAGEANDVSIWASVKSIAIGICVVGFVSTILTMGSILPAIFSIAGWLSKQAELLDKVEPYEREAYSIRRGNENNISHWVSVWLPIVLSIGICVAWGFALVFSSGR